jgi:hypothetical protein
LSASISKFESLTSGDGGGDNYSPESLRHFIEHYYLTSKHIPDGVLAGLMEIKRVFVSGSTGKVTRSELEHLHQLFAELNAITLDLRPHARVIFRNKKNASDAEIRAAAASLERNLARLGRWLSRENQSLKFEAVQNLANGLASWLQENGKDTPALHNVRQAAFILPEIKSILIAGDQKAIGGQEWPLLTGAVSRGLSLYLAAVNGFDDNLDAALIRPVLPEGAAGLVEVLSESANRHPSAQISIAEFKNLFAKIEQTDWLPQAIRAKGLTAVTQWFLDRPLGAGHAAGLGASQIAILRQQIANWNSLLSLSPQDSSALVQDFNKSLASSMPLSWDALGRMQFPDQMPKAWTPESRRHMVWNYVILHWLKESYVGGADGFNEDQITIAAKEILPLLQNFGWLKATKDTIGRRILREADLFTLASNGDGQLDLNEATRYLAFVVSSYRTAQVWLETAAKVCQDAQADCVRSVAAVPGSLPLNMMPRLQQVMLTWEPGQFTSFMKNAEITVLNAPEALKFTTGDLLQTFQLFEYVEVFYELYDADHNERIDLAEATEAFKVYGPTLGRLLPQSDLSFFTFMMKYGDTPFNMFGGQIAYNYWRWHPESWSLAADRNILMSILSQLAKLTSQ